MRWELRREILRIGRSDRHQGDPHRTGSPWQNAYVERLIGSIRRDCLDHVLIFNERGLRRILRFISITTRDRIHPSLAKDAPIPRAVQPPSLGKVIAIPQVGGLYHRYERWAA